MVADKNTASETAAAKRRRLVKNPETFRERAIKAGEQNDKPSRGSKIRKGTGKAFSPVAKTSSKVFNRQPFKAIRKALHYVGLVLVPPYFRNSWRELRLVAWPGFRESLRLTGAVLAFAIVFGAVIASVDYGLDKIFKHILLK